MRERDDLGWVQAGDALSSLMQRIAKQQAAAGTAADADLCNCQLNARHSTARGAQSSAGRPAR